MRRAVLTLAALAALVVPAVASAGDAPRLRAAVTSCRTGDEASARAAVFTASMPAADDTVRMAIRFDLQQRTVDGGVWERVRARSFGRWERSDRGVAGFVYAKDVHGLSAPGEYRAIVRFRWWSADGRRRTVRRVTRSCRQPDRRPDLVAGRLRVAHAGDPGLVLYRLPVSNEGRSPAGPFAVVLRAGGVQVARTEIGEIAPGGETTVELLGPPCLAGTVVELALDPDDAVSEADEGEAIIRPPCGPGG